MSVWTDTPDGIEMECGKDEGTSFGFNSKESSTDTVVGQVFVKKAPVDRQPSHPPIHLFWWRPSINKDSVLSFLFPPRPPVLFISPSIHHYGEHIRWPHRDAAHPASCDFKTNPRIPLPDMTHKPRQAAISYHLNISNTYTPVL